MIKANKRGIADLIEFARKPRTGLELATLRLPGFSWTRQGIFKRFRKLKVRRRYFRKDGVRYGYDFFDLPNDWQVAIMHHFATSNPQDRGISQKQTDAILYAAASRDKRFAMEWARREHYLDQIHEKIINIILACGERRVGKRF